ncbi:uncharacterized protein LOC143579188 [Bidens hawaiensis]|uniref:uncharacterized protein LOC143579188 n=1 Tax=Bidens hawaiensis TaxID=980011 RepID=UPI00404927D9
MSTICKSWIDLDNHSSPDFINGLKRFINNAKNHVDSKGKARSPCKDCVNIKRQDLKTIYDHVHSRGFLRAYRIWHYHGEKFPNHDEVAGIFAPRKSPRTLPTTTNHEMFDLIDDVMAEQYTNINEDEAGGIGLDKEFDQFFEELNTPLYPECSGMSSLYFLAKMMHIKVINKWTDSSFDQVLEFLREAFPKVKNIPASHYEAKRKLRKIGLGYVSIHACVNYCFLFWKDGENLNNCSICNASRWVDKNTKGKKVPKKVLRYFPLTPRLRRRYSSKFTAKDMTWHHTRRSTDGIMHHPVDGEAWQDFDKRYPDFRNVRLGLAADGFNPFRNMSLSYSMWPIVLTTYNTPPWLCMKESSLMLTLLIPDPKSPGKDIDIFLRPLVDELNMLWTDGVLMRDASSDTIFKLRATLLWTINDYPARSSLSGWIGQGYKGCPTCNKDTPSFSVKGKVVYVGHRRFLHRTHKWRDSLLFNGKKEKKGRPKQLSSEEIIKQLDKVPIKQLDKVPIVFQGNILTMEV